MEPILAAALATSAVVTTKVLEKAGEKIGETVIDKTGRFLTSLRKTSPETASAIEKVDSQELDYEKTVEIVKEVADRDSQFAQLLQDLVVAAKNDPNPKLSDFVSQQPRVYNAQKLAESIKNVFQGNTFINNTF